MTDNVRSRVLLHHTSVSVYNTTPPWSRITPPRSRAPLTCTSVSSPASHLGVTFTCTSHLGLLALQHRTSTRLPHIGQDPTHCLTLSPASVRLTLIGQSQSYRSDSASLNHIGQHRTSIGQAPAHIGQATRVAYAALTSARLPHASRHPVLVSRSANLSRIGQPSGSVTPASSRFGLVRALIDQVSAHLTFKLGRASPSPTFLHKDVRSRGECQETTLTIWVI